MATPFVRTTRALAHDGPHAAWAAWAAGTVLLAAWAAWMLLARVEVHELSRQARLEVMQAPHAVAAERAAPVRHSGLVLGRSVQAGELLVELDDTAARLRLAEERVRAEGLVPRREALRRETAALQAALAAEREAAQAARQSAAARADEAAAAAGFAREHGRRLRAEAAGGGVAEIDALRAEAEARRLGAAHQALAADVRRQALEALARERQGGVQLEVLLRTQATLDAEVQGAQAALARLEEDIERHRVRAPVAGTVAEITPLAAGTPVAAGQRLATVVPAGELRVVAEFAPGRALGRLQPGQEARMRLDGYPWAQYGSLQARVQRVATELRDGALRVELQVLAPTPATLPVQHGQSGVVEVRVEEAAPAALLLRAAGQTLAAATPAATAGPAGAAR